MNFSTKIIGFSLFSIMLAGAFSSCKQTNNDKYFYSASRDTIAPKIVTSVPTASSTYTFGQDIHMVGIVTDLESTDKGGKLQTLNLDLSQIDPSNNSVIKTYLNKSPIVDGKEGFTFNEKWSIAVGSGVVYCRFMATAKDYAGKITKDSVLFSVQ